MIVELAEDARGETFQVHCLLHCFLDFAALLSDLIIAKAHFLLETLYLIAKASHDISFLMSRSALNCVNDFTNLLMLILKILQTILLPSILSYKVLHLRCTLYIYQLLLQCLRVLVNETQKSLPDPHNHIPYIVFPPCQLMLRVPIRLDRPLRELPHLVKLVQRGDIALVNVLHVVAIDEAGETLVALLARRVEIQPAAMYRTPLTQTLRSPGLSRLHHCLNDI